MAKIISISGTRFALPEGITNKEVQALVGAMVVLTKLDYEYCWGTGENFHYACEGATVSIDDQPLMTKAEAKAAAAKSKADYEAREAAKEAAKAAAAAAA
jgi:hypothetical protein